MQNRLSLSGAVIFALVFAALPIGAGQTGAGSISGTVKDPAGAVIVGAQVSIRSDATGEARNT